MSSTNATGVHFRAHEDHLTVQFKPSQTQVVIDELLVMFGIEADGCAHGVDDAGQIRQLRDVCNVYLARLESLREANRLTAPRRVMRALGEALYEDGGERIAKPANFDSDDVRTIREQGHRMINVACVLDAAVRSDEATE